ncbi:Feruloyl esterase B-like protein [Hapsidospora chrysogenum ATCC 11550]|uniref:Carboxylic ester hydrolase n=1 Tax=Hapsidospora chrysogenum (strain ATCC 11550 / CBS 779.69 / DSM 880 / IAM 14645 / JCM 23072 / IMI 49137) TaxID=857340 RepID=A0A086SYJ2_HAPC1|nr:Feruloyl esterase B-like protein [Hapsidospora chrysogenum ATCC 11550]
MGNFRVTRSLAGLLTLGSSALAQLQNIPNFGNNPTGLSMDVYVPSNPPESPAVVLALHPCGGSGGGYAGQTGYTSIADQKGFIAIFPSSFRDMNCWDVASQASLTRDGGGDSTGLASMVQYALETWNADPDRIFVTGSSSGCMMTNVMSAAYPDLFAAASCYSGVAAGCLKGSPGSSPISADPTCANGEINLSAEEWAQRARDIYPGYSGSYPRFMTLHGTADWLVRIPNLEQQLMQWSTLHGVEQTASNPNTPQNGYTQLVYGDGTQLVGYSAEGVGHTVPVNSNLDMEWFGL